MISLNLYCFATILFTSYYFYDLYSKEYTFFVISMYILKSKFYFCLSLNFFIMIIVLSGRFLIRLFYGDVRLSELSRVMEKMRFDVLELLLFFISLRPTIDVQKIFFIILYFFVSFLTGIAYKRGAYLASINETNKKKQIKIISIYFLLILFNYLLFENSKIDEKLFNKSQEEYLIYFILNTKYLFLLITIIAKSYKLIINITSINMGKIWDYRALTFKIISTIKYSIKILNEFRLCYILIRMNSYDMYFFLSVFKDAHRLWKLTTKIYDSYNSIKYVNNLTDYDIDNELISLGVINNEMTKEEIEKIKHERINICNICLNEIEKGKYLNCGHIFHLKCIKEWVSLNAKCPICKSEIMSDSKFKKKLFAERFKQNNLNYNNNFTTKDTNIKNDFNKIKSNEFDNKGNKKTLYENLNIRNNIGIDNPLLERLQLYQNFSKTFDELGSDFNSNKGNKNYETGGISYGLPKEAIYNRVIENEIKRLKVELINKNMMNIYDDPKTSLINYLQQKNQ